MGFNLETQHSCVLPGGGKADYGQYSFCADALTVDVPVRLGEIASWWAAPEVDSDGRNLYTNAIAVIGEISNGYLTFARQTARLDLSQTFNYDVKGY